MVHEEKNSVSGDEAIQTLREKTRLEHFFTKRIVHFSERHHFEPRCVGVVLIVSLVLFAMLSSGLLYFGITDMLAVNSKTVNLGLKDIGELATQAGYFTSVQVIKGSRQLLGYDIPLTQNKFVFSYDGIIKAGLDFGAIELNVDDVSHQITVSLPEVRILSIEIDESSFESFDETNNIFNPLGLGDVNVSLIELKDETRENAISNGLLENARSNAEILIRGFLAGTFDLKEYSIIFE